ncbi:uncharacterized protein LOC119083714 isoform X2 [Bradysia coprophila]|uniref:uncharacterized protein LOC119083714 isoform X2 n=1 Tax=Bradysia coprophila TaxID=38358 RepID=UPI00187DBF95|nr:uncharacterized protein LOC119083714 isoform X2 [Bradysia coprophila]
MSQIPDVDDLDCLSDRDLAKCHFKQSRENGRFLGKLVHSISHLTDTISHLTDMMVGQGKSKRNRKQNTRVRQNKHHTLPIQTNEAEEQEENTGNQVEWEQSVQGNENAVQRRFVSSAATSSGEDLELAPICRLSKRIRTDTGQQQVTGNQFAPDEQTRNNEIENEKQRFNPSGEGTSHQLSSQTETGLENDTGNCSDHKKSRTCRPPIAEYFGSYSLANGKLSRMTIKKNTIRFT